MDHFIELDTVTLIAITLAALTSILAAVSGGHLHEWAPRFRLGFWMLVHYSVSAPELTPVARIGALSIAV